MNMDFERKLAIPMEVKEMYPLDATVSDIVEKRGIELKNIFSGKTDKLVLIIGPCSADNEDSVIDYLVEKSYSVTYGARNLRRTIQKEIEDGVAQQIIDSYEHPISQMKLAAQDGKIQIFAL